MKKKWIVAIVAVVLAVGLWKIGGPLLRKAAMGQHSAPQAAQGLKAAPTGDKYLDAIGKAVERLTQYQEANGAFIKGWLAPQAAITGLALEGLGGLPQKFLDSQSPEYRARLEEIRAKAVQAILGYCQADGGIYTDIPGYSFGVYSTAYVLVGLRRAGVPADDPRLQKAQEYLLKAQHTEKGLYAGGAGYQPGARPDLNNTVSMLEALEASGLPKDHPAYKNAVAYVSSCQNRSESNTSGIAVTDDGGFFYLNNPAQLAKGGRGTVRLPDGKFAYASYGTMSYAGLVSFLYAAVDKNDGRVKSAYNWIKNNYDLDENVGHKNVGLYYYYRIMAKALAQYGDPFLVTADGKRHEWARELADTIIKLQTPEGGWHRVSAGFMEDDEILVGAYMLRTLSVCVEMMDKTPAAPAAAPAP